MVQGRKTEFHDKAHRNQREWQLVYDRKIAKIRKEKGCSFKVAQRILRKRKLLEKLEQVEREERED